MAGKSINQGSSVRKQGDYTSNREAANPHNGTYNFKHPSRQIPAYFLP